MSAPQSPSSGGQFTIDLDRQRQAINDLEEAKRQLQDIRVAAARLARVTPPSMDAVSRDAAIAMSRVVDGGPRPLLAALDAGIAQMSSLADGLRAEVSAYERVENANAETLSGEARS